MVIAGAVFPVDEMMLILDGKGKPAKKYEIDKRAVVIKGSRVIRCRPKWFPWIIKVPLEIDMELISLSQVQDAGQLAGRIIGLGEFRPDPSSGKSGVGTYGRFTFSIT